ncbi:MAG: SEL1-like repeat protein [Muribaculaceae bacterium]|nr:SEL1-like repeat protein [Muribaculaceae bacterium]
MYHYGYGVAKKIPEARKWYEKAAAQGDEDAKERLKNL